MLKLSASSLDWALNNAERLGDTGFFPLPFEFSAIKHGWDKLSPLLASIDVSNWEARPHRECLSPKTALSFRIATELDPLDWLVYSALVYEIGEDLESYRLPQKDGNVFSWRFEPQTDGTMFSRKVGYFQFQEVSREYATRADSQYVVVADIADFYPSLYHHRVENALQSAAQSKADHVKAIMRLLSAWRERQLAISNFEKYHCYKGRLPIWHSITGSAAQFRSALSLLGLLRRWQFMTWIRLCWERA